MSYPARIVATLGPASNSTPVLQNLISAGADVFRFNMSHGTHAEHAATMKQLRSAAGRIP